MCTFFTTKLGLNTFSNSQNMHILFSMKLGSITTVISICLGTVNKKRKVVVQGFDASNEDDSLPNKNEW